MIQQLLTNKKENTKQSIYKIKIQIETLTTLIDNLNQYKNNTINKTFFDKFYKESKNLRCYHTQIISKKDYYDKYLYYYQTHTTFDIKSRNKQEILDKAKDTLIIRNDMLDRFKKQLEKLEKLDGVQLQKDILAVYHKHDKPCIWYDALNLNNIKFIT